MNDGRALETVGPWGWLKSGVGYHLDNVGSWLIEHAPSIGRIYASALTPLPPKVAARPGWKFGEEYYDQRRWMACRRGALWETARRKGLTVPLTVPWHGGTMIEVTLGNDNSLCLYVCGSFEPNEFAFLDRMLKPGMTFVDVGANDGYFAIFAGQKVGAEGRVVAIEPSSRERAHLFRNMRLNSELNVTIMPVALGAAPGFVELKLADGRHAGHNSLGKFMHADVVSANAEQVEMMTLDGVVEQLSLQRVDVAKIDVEGAEDQVIAGGLETLRRWRPILLLEVHDGGTGGSWTACRSLLELLKRDLRYDIHVFSLETGEPVPWRPGQPLSPNIVAIPAGTQG